MRLLAHTLSRRARSTAPAPFLAMESGFATPVSQFFHNWRVHYPMPKRRYPLTTGRFYHIFNRSVASEKIFYGNKPFRFINMIDFYRITPPFSYSYYIYLPRPKEKAMLRSNIQLNLYKKVVNISAFAIMPTHFHLLVQQVKANGIHFFMKRLKMSYAQYYNKVQKRHGPVFADSFNAKPITSSYHLLEVSRYIHRNPIKDSLMTLKEAEKSPLLSLRNYRNANLKPHFVNPDPVMRHFKNYSEYIDFVSKPGVEREELL